MNLEEAKLKLSKYGQEQILRYYDELLDDEKAALLEQIESTDGMTGLYRMNIDGTQIETIAIGNITNIHCTSKYTFFQYYEDQGVLYRVSTSGADTSVEQITIK